MKVVIALGGNALGKNPQEQLELVKQTAKIIVDLVADGTQIIITHGNGPQVGMINLAMDMSDNNMPFAECGAMSQGYIGYHLQQAIQNELKARNIEKECVTIVTQVEVDINDEAFNNPTKPIGVFYTKEEAKKIEKEQGYVMKEDANRGYRRVVPSPKPKKIVELETIKNLLEKGKIIITCGGGGIPVIKKDDEYVGIDAVIDKDNTSAKLATDINADMLMILTAVEKVSINFGKKNEKQLDIISINQAKKYIKNSEFAKGSMLPKIEACMNFVNQTGNNALITSLSKAKEGLEGETGTIITKVLNYDKNDKKINLKLICASIVLIVFILLTMYFFFLIK